jgi:hypothetical protein
VLTEIVFAEMKMPLGVPGENKWQKNQVIVRKVLEIVVFCALVLTAKSYTLEPRAMQAIMYALLGIELLIFVISSIQKRVIFRLIRCPHLNLNS